jgi:fused signal recognition particle receptor
MNHMMVAAMSTENALFVGLIAAVVVIGIFVVFWSRRKGEKKLDAAPAEELEGGREEAGAVVQEAGPEELLPMGRTIQQGLEKTRKQGFVARLTGLFRKELDVDIEQQLEEVLLTSDIGVKTAQKLLAAIKEKLDRNELKEAAAVWELLRSEVKSLLHSTEGSAGLTLTDQKPWIIAVVGVNGTGKTTTIGKLAAKYRKAGKQVLMVAADTFRAAAVEQLAVWAERSGAEFHRGEDGQDPASVAFDGIKRGQEAGVDVILIDTAGRLHTQKNLVEELKKIIRVCGKASDGAPHETLLVLDSTTGQNAIQQATIFGGAVGLQGIVLTKLDGTAKGGVVIGICDQMQIPVKFIGVGEQVEDLLPFDGDAFLDGLFGEADGDAA